MEEELNLLVSVSGMEMVERVLDRLAKPSGAAERLMDAIEKVEKE